MKLLDKDSRDETCSALQLNGYDIAILLDKGTKKGYLFSMNGILIQTSTSHSATATSRRVMLDLNGRCALHEALK